MDEIVLLWMEVEVVICLQRWLNRTACLRVKKRDLKMASFLTLGSFWCFLLAFGGCMSLFRVSGCPANKSSGAYAAAQAGIEAQTALYSSYTLRKWHGESWIIQWNPFWGNQTM